MMSFCRKSVHSLLGLSDSTTTTATDHHDDEYQRDIINPQAIWSKGLISLVTAATNDATRRRSPNVLESSAMVVARTPPPRKDPGGIGFIDDIGGGVDGLMSCTESLGFESSDERRVDDDGDELRSLKLSENWSSSRRRTRRRGAAEGRRRLPPPLSSLDRNGQPSFFLRPVRKDGRLELTEVRINRPEILRAYRGDGRLRLHLIRDLDDDDNDDHENCIKEEPEQEQEQQQQEEEEEEERSDVVSAGEERRFPVSSTGGGEGSFRRCQQKLQLHGVWRQHCVSHHQARRLHVAV